jgi:hypothetical protein
LRNWPYVYALVGNPEQSVNTLQSQLQQIVEEGQKLS